MGHAARPRADAEVRVRRRRGHRQALHPRLRPGLPLHHRRRHFRAEPRGRTRSLQEIRAPGQPGNFAVAGHRVGKGAPFNDLDLLNPCDAVVIETQSDWFVYRMLPTADQPVDAADPRCEGVEAQTGEYEKAVGRRIVTPDMGEVVLPVPGNEGAEVPENKLKSMLTLTTCHPKFSNAQRMIIHAVLVRSQPKGTIPPRCPPSCRSPDAAGWRA
ncbi:sortase domain-bontaining protein [Actinokineospora soli]|uniref:Sortase domain-bontaining protein n=1 Tax=Actinokineospora soli TaxID=1048753 RepID=A0ABW2TJC7_9PSEU